MTGTARLSRDMLKGRAQTVLGLIDPAELGPTLMHEHLQNDCSCWWNPPTDPARQYLADSPVRIEILSELRQDPVSTLAPRRSTGVAQRSRLPSRCSSSPRRRRTSLTSTCCARPPKMRSRLSPRTAQAIRAGKAGEVFPHLFPKNWPKPVVANFCDIAARFSSGWK